MTKFIQIKRILFAIFGLLFLISGSINGQNDETKIGQIFTNAEANQQFGAVVKSVSISSNILKNLMAKSKQVLMFNIIDGEVYVLNNKREVIYPEGQSISSEVKFAVYSLSIIEDLILEGKQSGTVVEQRSEVLSLTNGIYTLERADWCPPYCP